VNRVGAVVLALAIGCGGNKTAPTTAPREAEAPASYVALDPDGAMPTESEEVSFTSGGHSVPGTHVRPTTPGRHPALVLMAGSGPTDRDWNSPLLPGKNGSAKLLAEALAARGVIVLRFDKASVGGNKASLENVTFDIYRDEGQAALAFLRARPDVAAERLYLAGHSEGGMHAVRVAAAEGDKLAGLLLLSTSGRSMASIILTQLTPQLKAAMPAQADALLAAIKQAIADFLAGKAVDPKQVTQIPPLQQLLQALFNPATATLSRSMIGWESRDEVKKLALPIFVYNGAHDIQVDPELDAKPLAASNPRAELFIAPEADHVLKHETRSMSDLRANLMIVQTQMNAESRTLDPATLEAITDWLIAHPD
jgi:pimeloyl-ACP methyl ester carboxylesterase